MGRGIWKEEYKDKYGLNNVTELRLIPYLQYLCVNHQAVDPHKINAEERKIMGKWRDEGRLTYSMSEPVSMTKETWDWMNEIMWESYAVQLGGEQDG